jgi:uncharacterized membrane protein (DUF485 family)
MGHGPATDWGKDKAIKYKTKIGLILFIIYGIVYSGFIFINAIFPKFMGIKVLFGVNLAIYYGFGLIIFAIILGIIYNYFCTKEENRLNIDDQGGNK